MMVTFHDPLENVGMDELAAISDDLLEADVDGVRSSPPGI